MTALCSGGHTGRRTLPISVLLRSWVIGYDLGYITQVMGFDRTFLVKFLWVIGYMGYRS